MAKLIVDGQEIEVPAEYTLMQACEAAGAQLEDVVRALREPPASADGDARDWTAATMTELVRMSGVRVT